MVKKLYEESNIQAIANSIRAKNGTTDTYQVRDMAKAVDELPSGGGYTGHVDEEGLRAIGWEDDDIQLLKDNIFWNEEDDDAYKLTDSEKQVSSYYTPTRFAPKLNNAFYGAEYNNRKDLMFVPDIKDEIIVKTYGLSFGYWFKDCKSLKYFLCRSVTGSATAHRAFYGCNSLIKMLGFSNVKITDLDGTFMECCSLQEIKLFDTSICMTFESTFNGCYSLKTIPDFDTSNTTIMLSTFAYCRSLIKLPTINTSKVTNCSSMCVGCYSLSYIPELDLGNSTGCWNTFSQCYSLTYLGGFKDLGKSFSPISSNQTALTLDLSSSNNITHDSLMNVINKLYNITSQGYTQKLVLGSTNLAKLTSEEIAIATNKGWTVS